MEDELDDDTIPGLGSMKDYEEISGKERTSLLHEIEKDLQECLRWIRALRMRWSESVDMSQDNAEELPASSIVSLAPTESRLRVSADSTHGSDPVAGAEINDPTPSNQGELGVMEDEVAILPAPFLPPAEVTAVNHESSTLQLTTPDSSTDNLHNRGQTIGPSQAGLPRSDTSSPSPSPGILGQVAKQGLRGKMQFLSASHIPVGWLRQSSGTRAPA